MQVGHIIFSLGSSVLLAISAIIVMHVGLLDSLLILATVCLSCFLLAEFDIMIDIKRPNLNWTNETAVIKQSLNAFFAILSGWIEGGIVIVATIFLAPAIGSTATLAIVLAFLLVLYIPVDIWLRKRGTRVFETL